MLKLITVMPSQCVGHLTCHSHKHTTDHMKNKGNDWIRETDNKIYK